MKPDPLADVPGPLLARWTPLWLGYYARIGQRFTAVHKLHMEYGPIVRIAPNHISVADKDALDLVYAQGSNAFDKSTFYHAFVSDKASVFSTTDRHDHAQKRRLVSNIFAAKSLQDCTPFIRDIVDSFVVQLDRLAAKNEELNLLYWFHFLAFDVLSDLAFGQRIGMVEKGSDAVTVQKRDGSVSTENAIALVDEREHLGAVLGVHPSFKFWSKFLPDPFFIQGRKSSDGLVDFARRQVSRRIDNRLQRNDILDKLIRARVADDQEIVGENFADLVAETVTLLIAGSDTTSNSETAIMHLLFTNPRVYNKLIGILEEAVDEELPTADHVRDIPYLDAVINEGLRYHATTAIGLHRAVHEKGAMFGGKYFPPGTEMSVPAWTIQHDPEIWGDPEVFRPERWIENPDLKKYLMTFGKGPRACLGRHLAYMEMRLVLSTVLLRYDLQLKSQVMETTEGFMHKPNEMFVRLSRRERKGAAVQAQAQA
ncbi:benzoate para-hydroxylase [Coniophora puteana RWD-64-598 SS2]|uniref:Benzoate para-hydroxylase n=1 Tax=Coniophora puteana (strain RWD-64-598) TaxID=741705 RepID=A0A5M3MNQ6_CONPW|nr:benzoate para-hydroxylase [Coniophora puteana RWD-64-598 SS2]EIW80743.1 benzoate para-hydroxylase [Coniophora puteana RWD-64-598 SS2]